jgi:hypothetical protein
MRNQPRLKLSARSGGLSNGLMLHFDRFPIRGIKAVPVWWDVTEFLIFLFWRTLNATRRISFPTIKI